MHAAFAALSRAASTATPTPTPAVDPNLVTPGPWGFVAIAFVALAVVLLVWDMMRRIRRGRIRSEIDEMLDAEEAAARPTTTGDAGDPTATPPATRTTARPAETIRGRSGPAR